ncbi:uncharacterized protein [Physcomitrium patens]|uniref:uncharacterized protein n=1 Tax=Physcomitrium patens TaxID=3218 RepID=UPI000D156C7C|nr:uncharacterized protein LOC112289102 [Physcomitrium patens]|eukprot:XP_024389822.1 uncharacterized protein LOC112289102 [Physcomitrella patens]
MVCGQSQAGDPTTVRNAATKIWYLFVNDHSATIAARSNVAVSLRGIKRSPIWHRHSDRYLRASEILKVWSDGSGFERDELGSFESLLHCSSIGSRCSTHDDIQMRTSTALLELVPTAMSTKLLNFDPL